MNQENINKLVILPFKSIPTTFFLATMHDMRVFKKKMGRQNFSLAFLNTDYYQGLFEPKIIGDVHEYCKHSQRLW